MPWLDYAITADGNALEDYCDRAVIVTEGMANREDANFKVPGLEGEMSFSNKLWDSGNVILITFLKYADADGLITHADGSPGHVYDNFSALKQIFGKNGLVDLRRTVPSFGEVRMDVEMVQGPSEASFPAHRVWVLKAPKPFWRSLTPVVLSATTNDHTPAGDAPIDDMTVVFAGNGRVTIGEEFIDIAGSSAGVTVDCGARTILQSATPRDRWFSSFSDRWLRLQGGVEADIAFTGSVTSLTYYPKWHGGG